MASIKIATTAVTNEKAFYTLLDEARKKIKNVYNFQGCSKSISGIEYVNALDDDNNVLAELVIIVEELNNGKFSAKAKIYPW